MPLPRVYNLQSEQSQRFIIFIWLRPNAEISVHTTKTRVSENTSQRTWSSSKFRIHIFLEIIIRKFDLLNAHAEHLTFGWFKPSLKCAVKFLVFFFYPSYALQRLLVLSYKISYRTSAQVSKAGPFTSLWKPKDSRPSADQRYTALPLFAHRVSVKSLHVGVS